MRNYTFRKQTQQDFQQRVKRIDPHYHAHGSAKRATQRPSRPVLSLLLGFGWATLLVTVARNRSQIEDSLLQGTLPAQYHDYVFYMLAGLLAISAVLLAGHLVRFIVPRGARHGGATPAGFSPVPSPPPCWPTRPPTCSTPGSACCTRTPAP